MTECNKKIKTRTALNKLPCQYCMDYMANDIRFRTSQNLNSEKEILYYLKHIRDPKVNELIIKLLKSIACF